MKRSKFSLSHYRLQSHDMGELVPCSLVEVLPGDTIQAATTALVRASPLLAPVMHPVDVRLHWWFVPHRLVWTDWEDFITGGPDNNNASVFPTISLNNVLVGSLADYLGQPLTASTRVTSALPFRAYQLIYNEWYRDQDLVTPATMSTASGTDNVTSVTLRNCAWEKDYFTSARPWEQKGPDITIPIGDTAPVIPDPVSPTMQGKTANDPTIRNVFYDSAADKLRFITTPTGGNASFQTAGNTGLVADLAAVTGISVIELREYLAAQRWSEARARFGSRYTEYLRFLGVRSSDARLQRPEYIGGGTNTMQFSEVLQTAPDSAAQPVGALKGHGIGVTRSRRWRRFFEEHGYLLCLASVRPKTIYNNGIPRTWNRRTKEEFFQREYAHIGQQAVLNKEVYASHTTPDGTFGYQDRYDEYRRMESMVAGEFRNSTLDYWHLARVFTTDPTLNAAFVNCVPTERVFAASTNDVLYCHYKHSIQARRIVPKVANSFIF